MSNVSMGVRRFGRINWVGTFTLIEREIRRFMKVWTQTVMAPLINAGLLLMIFTIAIGPSRGEVMGMPFMTFLAPGILTMTVIQNAFANTSSSIASAKVGGNIVDTLMPPLSAGELVTGYIFGAVARGALVALVIGVGSWLALGVGVKNLAWVLTFVFLGSVMMGGLGMIAGIFANKFDQLSAISNFIVTPLANPFFYIIDGVRFGMIGVSDSSPWTGLAVVGLASLAVLFVCWRWLAAGYRLKA